MTEDEAKTKWCPFARVAGPMATEAEGTSYNRWPSSDGTTDAMLSENRITLCIGSACMAWREREEKTERRNTPLGEMPVPTLEQFEAEGWRKIRPQPRGTDGLFYERTISMGGGYCGLAGSPQ